MAVDLNLLAYGLMIGLFAGTAGGLMAGLAGLGGGLIYVPVFYALMPEGKPIAVPVMASMIAIIITGVFSTRAHWKLGHIDVDTCKQLLPGLIPGAMLGLWLALKIPEYIVLTGLAVLDGWIAWDYGRDIRRRSMIKYPPGLYAGPIGYISGTLGIGGGTMLVPLLRRSLPLRQAVGTSAMCGMLMATAAVLVNLLLDSGWQIALGHQGSFLVGVWLGILLILPPTTRWSASLHSVFSDETIRLSLKALFATLSAGLLITALWQGVT